MNQTVYIFLSVFIVSIISLIGILTIAINKERLKNILIYFISFSAGALFGDTFIHLLPEAVKEGGFTLATSLYVLSGIIVSFIIEKIICWRHCHLPITESHVHRYAYMNIFGDIVHNFIDGLIIGAAYIASIPVGVATTIAVILHEIPQEIGDFGVLLHGGFTRGKALFYNFVTALTAVLGAVLALVLTNYMNNANLFLLPFAAGSFIYIAGADLIPELHKETRVKKSAVQITFLILGVLIMFSLTLLE